MVKKPTTDKPSRRVTIMITDDLDKRVRMRQAKLIQTNQKNHSYSSVINEVLAGKYKI
jgi:hypothetical protein